MNPPSAAYTTSVKTFAAMKARLRKSAGGSIGCAAPPLDQHEADRADDPEDGRDQHGRGVDRAGASMSAYVMPASAERAEQRRRRCRTVPLVVERRVARLSGTRAARPAARRRPAAR